MLILLLEKRPRHDEVLIGDNISVKLLNILPETGQVQLGIEAPKDVIVDRKVIREAREKRIQAVFEQHERHHSQ